MHSKPCLLLLVSVFLVLSAVRFWPCQACTGLKTKTKIQLDNNGYKNILIGIEAGVKEDSALIERIKKTFSEASALLFNVTRHRAYFKEITILVPNTWQLDSYADDFSEQHYYENKIQNATWENFDRADICIESRSSQVIDTPYVVNYATGCGEPALHLHFTPEYFVNEQRALYTFGPYSNVLVHEWAHFRYGVFDEYPHKTPENNQEFYINERGEVEATRCSAALTGHVRNASDPKGQCRQFMSNGLPSNDCSFEDDVVERDPRATVGSLMYRPSLQHLTAFCDNDPEEPNTFHNRFAPTLQNKECNGRSVWEVLRDHVDFAGSRNPPVDVHEEAVDTTPRFQLVKKRLNKVVLVFDRTLKTRSPNTLREIKRAINTLIKQMTDENDLLGIVHFEAFAEIVMEMTLTTDSQTRQRIYERAIPKFAKDTRNSNIYNALSLSILLLRSTLDPSHGHLPSGGRIVLITNSKADAKYPNRHSIFNKIYKNKITIDVLQLSDTKDELLSSLAKKTDGLDFLIQGKNEILDISDSIISFANQEMKLSDQIVELSDSFFLHKKQESTSSSQYVLVDETLASRQDAVLMFKFSFEKLTEHVDVEVVDPKNKTHMLKTMDKCRDTSLFETVRSLDKTRQEVVCQFPWPKRGKWIYTVKTPVLQAFDVKLKVLVYFKRTEDIPNNSYYPNYYSNRIPMAVRARGREKRRVVRRAANVSVIKLEARWSRGQIDYPGDTQILYASVSKNLQPILNASVRALIYRPSGDYISVELYDNGLNADRYANDGVYTRYFTNFNENGVYSGRVELKTDELSVVNTRKIVGINSFDHFPTLGHMGKLDESVFSHIDQVQRTSFIGSFNLENFNVQRDLMPPSTIKDLRVTSLNETGRQVTLRFTAPGDNADLGTALRYDLRASYDPKHLYEENYDYEFEATQAEFLLPVKIEAASFHDLVPNQGGFEEFMTLDTSAYADQDTVSLKMRAVDVNGNRGQWSAILTVKLSRDVKLAPSLKHFESALHSSQLNDVLKKDQAESSIYWEMFLFLVVMFITIGFTQVAFLLILAAIEVIDKKSQHIKPVRV